MHLQDKALNQAVEQFQAAYDNLMAQVRRVTEGPVEPITPANLTTPDKIDERLSTVAPYEPKYYTVEERIKLATRMGYVDEIKDLLYGSFAQRAHARDRLDELGVPAAIPAPTAEAPVGWLHGDLHADAERLQANHASQEEIEKRLRKDTVGEFVPFECDYVVVPATAQRASVVKFFTRHNGFAQVAYGEELAATREARKAASETTPLPQAGYLARGGTNPFIIQAAEMAFEVIYHPDAGQEVHAYTIEGLGDTVVVFGLFVDGAASHLTAVSDTPQAKQALIKTLEEKVAKSAGSSWRLLETHAAVKAVFDLLGEARIGGAVPCRVQRDHLAVYLVISQDEAVKLRAI